MMSSLQPKFTQSSDTETTRIAMLIGADAGKPPILVAREHRGFSREKLAYRAGTTIGTIAELDGGLVPDALLMEALSNALNVPSILLAAKPNQQR